MHRQLCAAAALAVASWSLGGAASAQSAVPAADDVGECATVTASARLYYAGYKHVVTLGNHCPRAVSCEVWTNVDPTPHFTLTAKPGESAEVITRVGSPSRDVQAGKVCHFAG